MNKVVFAILLILVGAGLFFRQLDLLLIFAFVKVMLVIFFYMELRHTHAIWKVATIGLILTIFGGLVIF